MGMILILNFAYKLWMVSHLNQQVDVVNKLQDYVSLLEYTKSSAEMTKVRNGHPNTCRHTLCLLSPAVHLEISLDKVPSHQQQ